MVLCVSIEKIKVKEGELKRLIKTGTVTKFIAQESLTEPLKFCLVGIDTNNRVAYIMRHGRVNELRFWRLDNLAKFLKEQSPSLTLEVQLKQQRSDV